MAHRWFGKKDALVVLFVILGGRERERGRGGEGGEGWRWFLRATAEFTNSGVFDPLAVLYVCWLRPSV